VQSGEHHDEALPRPSYDGLFRIIYCSRCGFLGLGATSIPTGARGNG